MGIHDSVRGKLIAEVSAELEGLLQQLRVVRDDDREDELYALIREKRNLLKQHEALPEHNYWCDFCHKDFTSIERAIITLRCVYTHQADGTAQKHWLDGRVLVMCPSCFTSIDPIEGATVEPD